MKSNLILTDNKHLRRPLRATTSNERWCGEFRVAGRPIAIELEADKEGLTRCTISDPAQRSNKRPGTDSRNPHLEQAIIQLTEYFEGKRKSFNVPLHEHGTEFQKKVWQAAREIPAGDTQSYSWIASQQGKPKAIRAAGTALGANPLPIFTPCHRVLRSDGGLGGFSGGLHWKQALLQHEQASRD
jgi:O-6-methylguanine DNA methyltransferase